MLVVIGGLPGTGKTSAAQALAAKRGAVYLRIDVIEQAMRSAKLTVGPAGYAVAQAVAASNLALGQTVIADCVNPVPESRQGWRDVAAAGRAGMIEVELVCSDPIEHRRRVEARRADIAGLRLPTWQEVIGREYVPLSPPGLTIDTATTTRAEAVAAIERAMAASISAPGA